MTDLATRIEHATEALEVFGLPRCGTAAEHVRIDYRGAPLYVGLAWERPDSTLENAGHEAPQLIVEWFREDFFDYLDGSGHGAVPLASAAPELAEAALRQLPALVTEAKRLRSQ